jgi:hypothetical protein
MSKNPEIEETYSEAETVARREAALKRALAMPHRPHKSKDGDDRSKPKRVRRRSRTG